MTNDNKYVADIAIPPGETILEMLETYNMTQVELAARMGFSKKHVNEIIKGKARITAETAVILERIFSLSASFWLNLETDYREALARIKEKKRNEEEETIAQTLPYAEMANKGWVAKTRLLNDKINNLRNFFRVSNLTIIKNTPTYSVAFRTTQATKASELALAAWLEKGRRLANDIDTKPFSKEKLEGYIPEFRKMTKENTGSFYTKLENMLANCGVAFVLVPHLGKTYAHGAVSWLSKDKVMMQLSLRYRYSDIFWFSFFHELGHILLHGKREDYIEWDDEEKSEIELQADDFAANTLIPEKEYNNFIKKGNFNKIAIINFADKIEISPGILVGRLQHDNIIEYYKYYGLKTQYKYTDFNK